MTGVELPKTMPAVVCHGPYDYRLEEVPVPEAELGEVVIQVEVCGVCASDMKCYTGAPLFWGDEHRVPYVEGPVIAGHEFTGKVVQLGQGVTEKYGLQINDTAIAEQIVPCWDCRYCQTGKYWLCKIHNIFGFQQVVNGGMAKYMKFPARSIIHKVPDEIPPSHAAVIEPLSCSIHAVQRGEIEFGDVVVIAGAGTLGLGMVGAARLKNPGRLISVDLVDKRLQIAEKLGADISLNPSKIDVVEQVLEMTDGYGCDVYIEATGHPSAVEQGLRMICKAGTFVEFSVMREPVTVDWTIIGDTKELNIHGAHLGPHAYPLAIDYIHRGMIDVGQIVTHQLSLEKYVEAFEMVQKGTDSIKVQLIP
ncbi:TPA: erythritol/L-threitol dehydrogenase [Candidatus Poribacteria bacterium]|nr:erythritol/L-threitol dehydrogenase [Candidatus Poribacteria bacterium]HIN28696.1 erythritol/L-threitol dehydrogenase [Candidatus Poribacteria bacterium]HIO48258.1 erythritol/L-threitol dehydrogenase [Candidatus Poribacteria bacterium]